MTLYRLSWELVRQGSMHKYCNADPIQFSNAQQIVPNSEIPDEDWHPVFRETEDPWDQFWKLKEWEEEDREFVRSVKLEKRVSIPQWEEVPTSSRPFTPAKRVVLPDPKNSSPIVPSSPSRDA